MNVNTSSIHNLAMVLGILPGVGTNMLMNGQSVKIGGKVKGLFKIYFILKVLKCYKTEVSSVSC